MSKLKEARESQGLSQRQLAEKAGVNVQMIQHYEQEVRDINKAQAGTLYRLSEALGCVMEELIENERL